MSDDELSQQRSDSRASAAASNDGDDGVVVDSVDRSLTSQIQVFSRIKPSPRISAQCLSLDPYANTVTLSLPPSQSVASDQYTRDYINNQKSQYTFSFHGLIPPIATQSDVFDTIGRQCVATVMEGFNATIFAYGQTGSGKTFTVTGGSDSYESRGLIPRTLAHIFDIVNNTATDTQQYTVKISYLEIYNDHGYDLLDRSEDLAELTQLPKVTMMEDDQKRLHLQGLGEYSVQAQEDALELLFRGDTNRMICETPSNDASSRSHCIFTITIECRNPANNKVRRSKLHLVDLAGSERIKKTNVTGKLVKEATAINLSLHHLEQVIVALHERSKGKTVHVPYRNSMMTNVLRDSLGGNCRTVMVATLSGEPSHIDESISTARFAARVSQIVNKVWIEEDDDYESQVKKLKFQVKDLKDEVRKLRGERGVGANEALSEEEKRKCCEITHEFIRSGDVRMLPLHHESKIGECLKALRLALQRQTNKKEDQRASNSGGDGDSGDVGGLKARVTELEEIVRARDQQIQQLLQQVKQRGQQPPSFRDTTASTVTNGSSRPSTASSQASSLSQSQQSAQFESFYASYESNRTIESKKDELRALIDEAKSLGERINASREAINKQKALLQAKRVQREVSGTNEDDDDNEDVIGERLLRNAIEKEKKNYRDCFELLKQKKQEIDHLKAIIERSRRMMQMEFEKWQKQQLATENGANGGAGVGGEEPDVRYQRHRQSSSTSSSSSTPRSHHHQHHRQHSPTYSHGSEEQKELLMTPIQGPSSHYSTPHMNASPSHRPSLPHLAPLNGSSPSSRLSTSSAASQRSASVSVPSAATPQSRLLSTGNAQADKDIESFYALRDQLVQQTLGGWPSGSK